MLKRGFKAMLAEANAVIETVSVPDLAYHLEDSDTLLVDVRDLAERERDGAIPDSVHVSRGLLEFKADPESPVYDPRCGRTVASSSTAAAVAARRLPPRPSTTWVTADVASLAGGYAAWRKAQEG